MSKSTRPYDFVVVGKYRNRDALAGVVAELRAAGKSVYSFLDKKYQGDGIDYDDAATANPEQVVATIEGLTDWQTNPTFRKIFETDMEGLRRARALVLVFPAGLSSHTELGVAYGMGKKCYGIGRPEKIETLYGLFDGVYPNVKMLLEDVT